MTIKEFLNSSNLDKMSEVKSFLVVEKSKKIEWYEFHVVLSNGNKKVIKSSEKPILNSWLTMMDFNLYEDELEVDHFIDTFIKSLDSIVEVCKLELYDILEYGIKNEIDIVDSFTTLLEKIPALGACLMEVSEILEHQEIDLDSYSRNVVKLRHRLSDFKRSIENQRKYVINSLIQPVEKAFVISPLKMLFLHEVVLNAKKERSAFSDALYKTGDEEEAFFDLIYDEFEMKEKENDDLKMIPIESIEASVFKCGVKYLIENEMVLKNASFVEDIS